MNKICIAQQQPSVEIKLLYVKVTNQLFTIKSACENKFIKMLQTLKCCGYVMI